MKVDAIINAAKESLLREALKMYIMAILQLMELDY